MKKSEKENIENETPIVEDFVTSEDFSKLLEEYEKDTQVLEEGSVVKGVIVGISDKGVAIDIGAKSIGYIPITEFRLDGAIEEGDVTDVFLELSENKRGELIISRDNARRHNTWNHLKQSLEDKTVIEGLILGRVKGGYAVDVNGVITFLPGSQVDTMLLTDDSFLINKMEKLMVLKIDDVRGNVVVSRRAILEGQRDKERDKVLATIKVGDVLDGMVKNITDYGAFIDFGSFDGLLHLTDISWCRVRHPSEALSVGQEIKVQVIKYDAATKRVSLGMKQLQDNPWESIETRYPVGATVKGHVTNIATYGAFVEIENGIEGLVHVSEMSWFKNNNIAPNKILTTGQEVEVMVLDINAQNHRISLGIKQCEKNPWQVFSESHFVGDILEGTVRNSTEFGLFVGFDSGVDGLVHVSDSGCSEEESLAKKFKKDEKIKVVVLGSNYEKERISLGIKQLEDKNFAAELKKLKVGEVVSCSVVAVKKDYVEAELDNGLKATIKRLDISKNKKDQRTEQFEVDDRIDAKVALFNNTTGKVLLSIKDMESDQQEEYIYNGGNSSSGATLGSILGDVLQESRSMIEKKSEENKAKAAPKKEAKAAAPKVETKKDKEDKVAE